MNTPPLGFQDYLAQTFQAAQPAPGPVMLGAAPAPPPPMDPVLAGPPPAPVQPLPPPAAAPPVNVAAPEPQQPQVPQHAFPLVRVGGYGTARTPEQEIEMRGPTLRNAQGLANEAEQGAVGTIADRNQDAAAVEYGMALQQERQAQAREQGINQAQAERDEEMNQRLQDFDTSVKSLSQASMDPDRFWSSRSTGQKIAGLLAIGLGGFVQGARGGGNAGLDIINQAIDRDLKAQEFDFTSRRNAADGKQTAFALAMQKYGNQDAARAMARAASIDAAQAQLGQMRALYAGTDAANRADAAMAQLQREKEQQIAHGVRFLPSQTVQTGPQFYDPETGITYSNAEAKGVAKDWRGQDFKREEIGLNTAGDVIKEQAKVHAADSKDAAKSMVVLPNGDRVQAPSPTEAGELRGMAANANEVRKLVDQAKTIRSDSGWLASPSKIRELKRIQSNLVTAYGVAKKLGALSESDMNLALDAAGKITDIKFGVSDTLENYAKQTDEAWRARVKTYEGAPDSAVGKAPASFTVHGKKK